jgi:hypothetical protein
MAALTRAKIAEKALQKWATWRAGQTANPDDLKIATGRAGAPHRGAAGARLHLAGPAPRYRHPARGALGRGAHPGRGGRDWRRVRRRPDEPPPLRLQQWAGLRDKLIAYDAPDLPDCISVDETPHGTAPAWV